MIRYCKEIGLFALDRGRGSCLHQTEYCKLMCYNIPLYKWQKAMPERDKRNEEYWREMDGDSFRAELARKRNKVTRFRFMTRGEAFATVEDVQKVREVLRACPGILFWIPTRGWRDDEVRGAINRYILRLDNARVLASIDPSTSAGEEHTLWRYGWSLVYVGSNELREGYVRCQKTWNHETGYCADCTEGCFKAEQVKVHLRKHWSGYQPRYKDWQTMKMFE